MIPLGNQFIILFCFGLFLGTLLGIILKDLLIKEGKVIIERTIWLRPKEEK